MTTPSEAWTYREAPAASSSTDNETTSPRQTGVTRIYGRQEDSNRQAIQAAQMTTERTPPGSSIYTPQELTARLGYLPVMGSLIKRFTGDGYGESEPETFVSDIEVMTLGLRGDADKATADLTMRTQFRWHLAEPAATWLQELSKEKKDTWEKLKEAFLDAYQVESEESEAEKKRKTVELMQTYGQRESESLEMYIKRGQRLRDALPTADFLIHSNFVKGLADPQLRRDVLTQLTLRDGEYTFEDAKTIARKLQKVKEMTAQNDKRKGRREGDEASTSQSRSEIGSGAGSSTEQSDVERKLDALSKQVEALTLGGNSRATYAPPRPSRPPPNSCFNCGDVNHWASSCPHPDKRWPLRQPWRPQNNGQRYPLPSNARANVVEVQQPVDDDRYGPTAAPSRINCIMTEDPNGRVATTYHEPAMAAANGTRRTARTEPASGRVNKAPTGPRFTLPNDARVQEQPMQTRAQTQAQTQSTGTMQPIDEEVEMQDAEEEGTRRSHLRPSSIP